MQTNIHSKNLKLNESHEEYIDERIQRLMKYADRIGDESTSVNVEVHKNAHKTSDKGITMEITFNAPHATIRSEVHDVTIEAATDQAFEKLKKQIERYKGKNDRRNKRGKLMPEPTLTAVLDAVQEPGTDEIPVGKIVKHKAFPVNKTPFSDAEAVEQMELLGHNFFLYRSSDTSKICVAYKRQDGNYGILESED